MKKLSKEVKNYVLGDLVWKADLPAFLKEVAGNPHGPYAVTFTIVSRLLQVLTARAIEINDPALNIIMMNLALYEGVHTDEGRVKVQKLQEIIKSKL